MAPPDRTRPTVSSVPDARKRTLWRQRLMMRSTDPAVAPTEIVEAAGKLLSATTANALADELNDEGLAAFWHSRLAQADVQAGSAEAHLIEALRNVRWRETATYLAQRAIVSEIDRIFTARAITYAVFKGACIREQIWPEPSSRNAADIDVLVAPAQKQEAINALTAAGFACRNGLRNISHEVTLVRDGLAIDLHWDILRPGRTRHALVTRILDNRKRHSDFWAVGDTDTVFIMLVHPAFTRYVCNLALCNIAEFERWVRLYPPDWDRLAALLEDNGLKTAAWTVLVRMRRLLQDRLQVPAHFVQRISPGTIRRRYLAGWVVHELPLLLWNAPLVIPLAFTLVMHDTVQDAGRAAFMRSRAALR